MKPCAFLCTFKEKVKSLFKLNGIFIIFIPLDFLINNIFKLIFSRKTILKINKVDVFQRYIEVKERINDKDHTILEVGGAYSAIFDVMDIVNRKITIIDINKTYVPPEEINYFLANGIKLPFKDNSFDCLISVAMLEHVEKKQRASAINEWKRVAKKIIVYIPFGETAKAYDQKLFNMRKAIGIYDPWTKEHIQHGIPTFDELSTYFPNSSFSFIQNADLWLATTFTTSIPVFGRVLPGLIYALFSKNENMPPCIGCIIIWEKIKKLK